MMLCDFHIHTTFSDGSLEMRETIDLFGQAGFDVIAITDHVVNGDNVMGKFARRFDLSVRGDNFDEYLAAIREEAARAWDKYGMLVIPGVEISKNYLAKAESAHLLLLDIKEFIPACMDYEEIFREARRQGLVVGRPAPQGVHRGQDLRVGVAGQARERGPGRSRPGQRRGRHSLAHR